MILRHYRRVAPALDLAGKAYRAAVLSYDGYDRANAAVEDAIGAELAAILSAPGNFELWARSARFEASFAAYCGRRRGVGTASGTAALQLALVAAGVGPGDEVVTSAHTFIATALAIHNVGARPVLVDPDRRDLCVTADAIARALTPRTRAVLPVHMHGHVCDMPPILALAKERGLVVVEDCAQAHGATLGGQRVPIGPTGCFSFFASKPLGGAGNGGMIVTDDEALAARADTARDPEGGDPVVLRAARTPNYLDGLEAAVLAAKLPHLDAWRARRAENAAYYLRHLGHLDPVRPREGVGSTWYSFVVRVDGRDELKRRLLTGGIEAKIEYHPSFVRSPTFAAMGWRPADFPVAMDAAERGLSLPMHPFVTEAERARVVEVVRG